MLDGEDHDASRSTARRSSAARAGNVLIAPANAPTSSRMSKGDPRRLRIVSVHARARMSQEDLEQ